MRKFVLIAFCGLLLACSTQSSKEKEQQPEVKPVFLTGLDVEPLLKKADSVQVLFFLDPFGKDSIRYTRYYKYVNSNDTAFINTLLSNFQTSSFIPKNEKMPCRSQGKIHFFQRDQELKTVYFNITKENDCSYVYYIKDGVFYYFKSSELLKQALQAIRPKAK